MKLGFEDELMIVLTHARRQTPQVEVRVLKRNRPQNAYGLIKTFYRAVFTLPLKHSVWYLGLPAVSLTLRTSHLKGYSLPQREIRGSCKTIQSLTSAVNHGLDSPLLKNQTDATS